MSAASEFKPLSLCVLTVSDTRTAENDTSGDFLCDALRDAGHRLHERAIEPFEVGKSLKDAAIGTGLRILRGDTAIGFWEPGSETLQAGDHIIEIVPDHMFPKIAKARAAD